MRKVIISDITMKNGRDSGGLSLSFREKLELAKLLDRLGTDVIEVEGIGADRADALRIKSICTAVMGAAVAVPVTLDRENQKEVLAALKNARRSRVQVEVPVSVVQMEYLLHKKPKDILAEVQETVRYLKEQGTEVEFAAGDATRADRDFLCSILGAAAEAGASVVTVSDTAGIMLPEEFGSFIRGLLQDVPALSGVTLGVSVSNALAMADACAAQAVMAGAGELKVCSYDVGAVSLTHMARLFSQRSDALGASCGIRTAEIRRVTDRINDICRMEKSSRTPFENGVREEESAAVLGVGDTVEAVTSAAEKLGYDLSSEDRMKVFEAFRKIVSKKETVSMRELESIIAAEAMQVPETYKLEDYMISISGVREAIAHIKMKKDGKVMDGLSLGDGPIDASYLAIEQVTGCHYELDDFQIQAVTEGREAAGQTLVRLRSRGKLYAGRGISTDIVGSAILAYMNALNKIVYEEALQ